MFLEGAFKRRLHRCLHFDTIGLLLRWTFSVVKRTEEDRLVRACHCQLSLPLRVDIGEPFEIFNGVVSPRSVIPPHHSELVGIYARLCLLLFTDPQFSLSDTHLLYAQKSTIHYSAVHNAKSACQ